MAYTPQTWTDSPSTTTPISAARLTVMETGIDAADAAVEAEVTARTTAAASHAAAADPHTGYQKESEKDVNSGYPGLAVAQGTRDGTKFLRDDGTWQIAAGGGAPTGTAGGVLGGTYPNPAFAVDMATQVELDAEITLRVAGDVPKLGAINMKVKYALSGNDVADDAVKIRDGIAAEVAAGQADGTHHRELYFPPGVYVLSAATAKGGIGLGNSQIPMPYVDPTLKPKFTLVLKGTADASGNHVHWRQGTILQRAGTVFRSTLENQVSDATFGYPSIIGGPIYAQMPIDDATGRRFSNMLVHMDGIALISPVAISTIGIDMRRMGQFTFGTLSVTTNQGAVGPIPAAAENNAAVWMPDVSNNNNCDGYSLIVYNWPVGLKVNEHSNITRYLAIYCNTALGFGGANSAHGAYIGYMSAEVCNIFINTFNFNDVDPETGTPALVLNLDMLDGEGATTDIRDPTSSILGHVNFSEPLPGAPNGGFNSPVVIGAKRLKIIDQGRRPGAVTAPTVPASTIAFQNPLWRDAVINISGGAVTVIAIDGVTTGLTAGTVILPSGKNITLTYSAVPTWVWTLL